MTTTTDNVLADRITDHYRDRQEREAAAKAALPGLDGAAWNIELELLNSKQELVGKARWLAEKMTQLAEGIENDPTRKVYSSDAAASLHADVKRLTAQAEGLQRALEFVRAGTTDQN
jgi:hypothetical protein